MSRAAHRRWWRLLGGEGPRGRVAGDPPSANGASSLHLRWDLHDELAEVGVTLEVLRAPTVDRLYFWAVQADFGDGRGRGAGGGHLGLQWHPQHPGSTAVNWGGYDSAGRVLDGTDSSLPSALGNPHTRDYPWRPLEPYRLVVSRAEGADGVRWRGSVTRPDGTTTVVRDLVAAGDRITGVVMWSEVFARCDHPSVAVRWSDPFAVTTAGTTVVPARVGVNYQSHADGGCANTDSSADDVGLVQTTAVERSTPQGSWLPVPAGPGGGRAALPRI